MSREIRYEPLRRLLRELRDDDSQPEAEWRTVPLTEEQAEAAMRWMDANGVRYRRSPLANEAAQEIADRLTSNPLSIFR